MDMKDDLRMQGVQRYFELKCSRAHVKDDARAIPTHLIFLDSGTYLPTSGAVATGSLISLGLIPVRSTKMIKFVLMVNKQGQTRLAKYTDSSLSSEERHLLEAEIVRKCLKRPDKQCNFVEHRDFRVVYRRYASLFFMVGVDEEENPLAIMEFIHCMVETMDKWFGNVCELDIMFNIETVRGIVIASFASDSLSEKHSPLRSPPASLPCLTAPLPLCLQAHYLLEEMLSNGYIVETNKAAILAPIELLERAT